jgi:glycosyltransferase involved in cell wall biosynthesis
VLAQEKADLFISPDGYCSLRAKTPTLLVTHDLAYCHYPEHISRLNLAYMRWFMPRFSRRAERIATVSDFSKRDIALQHGVPLDKIDVVYNGCDQRFVGVTAAQKEALTLQVTGGRPYLLYVGSIHPRKNLPALLRAYETFRETHPEVPLQLVLAGRMAWQTGEVGRTLAAMRYRNDVHLTGYVPDNELPTLIAGAFAVVYVSLFEGFGLPILEAQQAGTAVICSNTSSMPEVAGDAAVLVDPTNPAAIARGISQLWDEPGLREALLARGAANAARFSWDRSAAALWESALRTLR